MMKRLSSWDSYYWLKYQIELVFIS
jgi:hypothetical protein